MDEPLKRTPRHTGLKVILVLLAVFIIFFTPSRLTVLLIGIDRPPEEGSVLSRTDTMILTTMPPYLPKMSLLSIPRDLWVNIPNYGENRINAAHYFAELYQPGTGMQAAAGVIEANFGVKVPYVIRLKFDGFKKIVEAMGGVTVDLPEPMSGLEAGKHHLDGDAALAFVRDRKGSDDFWRQKRGQMFLSAAMKEMLNPIKWVRIPAVVIAFTQSIDSNVPVWVWPRLIYGAAFSAVKGFDLNTLDWNWVTGWVTNEGAHVLLPKWDLILPFVQSIFAN
jgi:LCP family protein required for cell wall assembly